MTAITNHWGGILTSIHVEESQSIKNKDCTKLVQIDSHLQAVAVHVIPGGWRPVTIFSVYILGNNHLTTRDLSYLIMKIRGQILVTVDFNGRNCLCHDVDTGGEVIERFTEKHNLCTLNDGTHTYLKPQAQHVNKPTSAIDLTISTPRSAWEVPPDTHCSNHYSMMTSILPSVSETQPSCDTSHWVFSKADWEQFHDLSLERVSEDIQEEAAPFVMHITKPTNDSIPRAITIPKKSNPWFFEECHEAMKARRALDKKVWRWQNFRVEILSAFRRSHAHARGLFNQKKCQSWAEYISKLSADTTIKHVWDRMGKIYGQNICHPKQYLNGRMALPSLTQKILLMNMRQHLQTTPPLPITVLHSRP